MQSFEHQLKLMHDFLNKEMEQLLFHFFLFKLH